MEICAKSETKPEKCSISVDVQETKSGKRRRRSPPVVAFRYNNQQIEQQHPQAIRVDQTAAATTTTTKRSSRFRGVSRFNIKFYLNFSDFLVHIMQNILLGRPQI